MSAVDLFYASASAPQTSKYSERVLLSVVAQSLAQ